MKLSNYETTDLSEANQALIRLADCPQVTKLRFLHEHFVTFFDRAAFNIDWVHSFNDHENFKQIIKSLTESLNNFLLLQFPNTEDPILMHVLYDANALKEWVNLRYSEVFGNG